MTLTNDWARIWCDWSRISYNVANKKWNKIENREAVSGSNVVAFLKTIDTHQFFKWHNKITKDLSKGYKEVQFEIDIARYAPNKPVKMPSFFKSTKITKILNAEIIEF